MLHSANSDNYLLEISNFDNDPLKQYSPLFSLSPSLNDFADDETLHNFAVDDHHIKILPQPPPPDPMPAPKEKSGTGKRRRCYPRTDRHSKIRTLRGLRDRRMRLSVDVAGRFFALQDMLGFDRASSTVDWLLKQSSHAIEHRLGHFSKIFYEKAEPLPAASGTAKSRRERRNEARARARRTTVEKKKMRVMLEIRQHFDSIEKVRSPAGVEYSNCSSLVNGSE